MPISRSNTVKAKSPRSPAPSRTPSTPSTPRFLPPSHYAAAGGYNISNRSKPVMAGAPEGPSAREATTVAHCSTPGYHEDHNNPRHLRTGIVEMEAQLLPTLRDTIDKMTGTNSSRYSMSLHPSKSVAGDFQISQALHKEKNSVLRDEKRSRSSSRGPAERKRRGTPAPSAIPAVPASKKADIQQRTSREPPIPHPRRGSTPTVESTPVMPTLEVTPPAPQIPSGPVSRLKAPTKPALKSSLRSPMPIPGPSTPILPQETTPQTPTAGTSTPSSLRTMKSLLTRKCSGKLKSPFTVKPTSQGIESKDLQMDAQLLDPKRDRRVSFSPLPGELPRDNSLESKKPGPFADPDRDYPDPRTQTFQSNIPRPRQAPKSGNRTDHSSSSRIPIIPSPLPTDDSSDFERRYEAECRNKRRLTVANAEVASVSSTNSTTTTTSSNDDYGERGLDSTPRYGSTKSSPAAGQTPRQNRYPSCLQDPPVNSRSTTQSIGLGLSFSAPNQHSIRSSLKPSPGRRAGADSTKPIEPHFSTPAVDSISDSQSVTSSYSDDFSTNGSNPDYISPYSDRTPLARTKLSYSDELSQSDSDLIGGDEELKNQYLMHHHYREVSMDSAETYFRRSPRQSDKRRDRLPVSQEDHGEDLDEETESERDGYFIRRSRTGREKERRRSMGYGNNNAKDNVRWARPQSPPSPGVRDARQDTRSKSALSQLKDKGYELDDQEAQEQQFSPSLKDLIKRRHSLSKNGIGPSSKTHGTTPEALLSNTSNHPTRDFRRSRWARNIDDASEKRSSRSSVSPVFDREKGTRSSLDDFGEDPQTDEQSSSRLGIGRSANSPYIRDRSTSTYPTTPQSEAAIIAERYRSAAARERQAFGIPLSDSLSDSLQDLDAGLTQSDSDMSSLNESLTRQRDERDEGLGLQAEGMLERLGVGRQVRRGRNNPPSSSYDSTPTLSIVSPTLSSESTENDPDDIWQSHDVHTSDSLSSSSTNPTTPCSYSSDLPLQPTRESVIQEIFQTEEDLINGMNICMEYFILPLRHQNSRSWISGVPVSICRQFDWFDDILNLHEQVYDALCSARETMTPATDRVSESMRWWVMKVEVYQPYLVKLGNVKDDISRAREGHVLDGMGAEFAEFVRLREIEVKKEGDNWTLDRFLMLPVERLTSYQDLFGRLLDLTPKAHQDYLSTLSLARSTDMVIRVMTEVKIREDDYQQLKGFASQIQGLPTASGLATRDRRLLHSGPLQLVLSNLSEFSGGRDLALSPEVRRKSRSSRLLDAISNKPNELGRSTSRLPNTPESRHGNTDAPMKSGWLSRLPLPRRSRKSVVTVPLNDIPDNASLDSLDDISLRTVDVHAFVFTDLVLLAQQGRNQEYGNVSGPSWILSEDLAIFRPLSIARIRRRNAQEGMILSLESASVDLLHLNETLDFRSQSWRIVDLLIPPIPSNTSDHESARASSNDGFQPWLSAFRECCRTTLRRLTFVGATSGCDGSGALFLGDDKVLDTHAVVSSLAGSGLPLPRSPSGNLPDLYSDSRLASGDEREERGWWSLRYQQVFREFQRRDSIMFDNDDE